MKQELRLTLDTFSEGLKVEVPDEEATLQDFWLQIGDRVEHVKDSSWVGTITQIDANLIATYGVTTCRVQFDDSPPGKTDIFWTNRLRKLCAPEEALNEPESAFTEG